MNEKSNRMVGTFGTGLVRAALAALAITALASTPHAEAQRRPVAAAQVSAQQRASESAEAPSAGGVVNIQTASAEELQRLPGIGPSKAAAIVAFRDRTPFRRIEDLLRVRGIGRATFRRLRPMLTVSGPTTLAQDVRAQRRAPAASEDDGGGDAEEAPAD